MSVNTVIFLHFQSDYILAVTFRYTAGHLEGAAPNKAT